MTMDRVHNPHHHNVNHHSQTHQQQQPSHHQHVFQQQPQYNISNPQHHPLQQLAISTLPPAPPLTAQQQLYHRNLNPLNHSPQSNNNYSHQNQKPPRYNGINGPSTILNRPAHPPPPPPLAQQHQLVAPASASRHAPTSSQCCLPTAELGLHLDASNSNHNSPQAEINSEAVLDPSLPALATRLNFEPDSLRNSIAHSYVNTHHHHHQQYQPPSNLQTVYEQTSLMNQQHEHPENYASQTRHSLLNQCEEKNFGCYPVSQSNGGNADLGQDVQDHFTEKVIQAILSAKEALEKPIVERDERDIMLIDNLCSLVHGFDVFPKPVRRALAAQAVLIVIDEKGKELIVHNEELDSFCVLIFGECEQLNVSKTVATKIYRVGDSFGVCEPTPETIRFVGHMVTRCENCAFLCVERDDFNTILTDPANYPTKKLIRHRDNEGNIVCVSQLDEKKRSSGPIWSRNLQSSNPLKITLPDGHIICKATEACLLLALVDGYDRVDPDYVDDFLLLFRVFMTHDLKDKEKKLPPGMIKLCLTLAQWLDNSNFRDRVVKIILTWLGSYYHDFELNSEFSYLFFRVFESRLLNLSMNNQLHLLHVTLSTKSKIRHVTISRSSREAPLPFTISGGYEKNCGIFVMHANGSYIEDSPHDNLINYLMGTSATKGPSIPPRQKQNQPMYNQKIPIVPLRPGDQILKVNGTNFTAINLVEAQKKLDMFTHLSLTVRYNPSAFHEMRALPEGRRKSSLSSLASVSPFQPPTSSSRFTFNSVDQQSDRQSDQYPQSSPLFSANSNFGFRSMMKSGTKGDKSRLSSLISSSKQFVKQIRDSTAQSTTNNIETMSKTSDTNTSDEVSNIEVEVGRTKSNPELVSTKSRDKIIEPGLTNVIGLDNLTPSVVNDNHHSDGMNQTLVNVLKVFNAANNDSRYLLVHEGTTAREVVMVAVKEFNLAANTNQNASPNDKSISSLNWQLYEVSVVPESKTIKQKCLSEQTSRLAEQASLCSRFYIKNNSQSSFGPSRIDMGDDVLVNEILKESPPNINLTSLNAGLLAVELTLADFDKFRRIEPQQFVYDTFFDYSERKNPDNLQKPNGEQGSQSEIASLKSSSSDGQETNRLHLLNKTRCIPSDWMQEYKNFADISNKEMFWVVCEILNERNISRRVKVIKQFVRVADVCSQLRNYNSMFAIISGLGHSCVNRLRRTFDKLKPKYKNQLEKMRNLFDPSKNMSNYRMCLNQTPPPAIPLFPQIKKDLTFTKEGRSIFVRELNDSSDDEESESGYSQDTIKRKAQGDTTLVASDQTLTSSHQLSYGTYKGKASGTESESLLVNFSEIRQFTERVRNVIYFSSVPYSNDLLTDTKDNQRNQAQIKKMHEECLMRKRIRHYIEQTLNCAPMETDQSGRGSQERLRGDQVDSGKADSFSEGDKLRITYDERTLYQRSLDIEPEMSATHRPQPNQNANADRPRVVVQSHPPSHQLILTPAALNMHPPPLSMANSSPTLSKSSSLSSCSSFNHQLPRYAQTSRGNSTSSVGKFGTESTESLRKLQSLSETSDDWRHCNGGHSAPGGTEQNPRTKNLVPSRIFPPKGSR